MSIDDLNTETSLELPAGHLLVLWDLLSNKLSCCPLNDGFTEEEKRAIWALEDLCEQELAKKGFSARPEKEWDQLIERATEFVKTVPAEFLD